MLSSMGVEVVDERPYELENLPRPSYIYEFGLRYGRRPARQRPRPVPGRPARRLGRAQRDRRLQRLVLGGRPDLAAGDGAARLREVHEAGQRALRGRLHRGGAAQQRRHHPAAGAAVRGAVRPGPGQPARRRRGADREGRGDPEDASTAPSTTWSASTTTGSCAPTSTHILATLRTNYFQRADDGSLRSYISFKLEPSGDPRPARAAAALRDLRLLTAGRGRAPALRRGRPRWPALVGPARRLPHRGARPGQGADGQEHRDRAGRRQGRLLLQAAARPRRPRRVDGRGHRLLQDLHLRAARHHRQPGRRGDGAARATSSATTATTPTWSSPPTRAPRPSPTSPTAWPRTTASGWATRSRPAGRWATTTRRWASPPRAPGSRCSATSGSAASTARPRTSPPSASATCPATCSATACSAPSTSGWWRPSTTATSSSTPTPTRPRRSPSGSGCSRCRARAGRTTTPR